ncbi:ferritin-like domain-containing protein [Rhizomonospora bruguierae]|uniref:ferritin-like domain-containing protein n=1 Tax=Rhizomonospora bruguierae TaxID=1581705 RepID=UPI001BCDD610|nr:ferritin-like domain-containing protein [Micromonospora sp. NBRC 107566]
MSGSAAKSLGAALAGEHAAVYAYGVLGVRLTDNSLATAARSAEAAHRARRESLMAALAGLGTPGPAANAGYQLPFPVTDSASAIKLAVQVEEKAAALWRAALADTDGEQRRTALDALVDCAVRATTWRRAGSITPLTTTYPGRPV